MAKDHGAAAETLGEIESAADRLSDWLQENIRTVAAVVIGLLLFAGLGSWWLSARATADTEASAELARTREAYLSAMGAGPGALEVPELANREAADQIRIEYQARFSEVAEAHAGSVAGALAGLEAARLAGDAGRHDEAAQILERTLTQAPGDDGVRGMLLQGLAQRLEDSGEWSGAASRHAEAAELSDYPLRAWALADAARCHAAAGDESSALALYDRFEGEYPDLRLPDHLRAQHLELRAKATAAS